MICPLCGNEIPNESGLIGPYIVTQPNIHGTEEKGTIEVCGKCYLLTSMNDKLELLWRHSRT